MIIRLNTEMLDPLIDAYWARKNFFTACGITRQTGYRFRTGASVPHLDFLIRMRALLKLTCTLDEMLVIETGPQ